MTGQPVARRLADAHVARDDRLEDELREVRRGPRARRRARGACGRRASSAACRRRSGAGSARAGRAPACPAARRAPRARSTRSARHDDPVGGDERVDGQRPERRRAVQQDVREALAHGVERVAQTPLGARVARQLDVRAREVGASPAAATGARSPSDDGVGGARRRRRAPRRCPGRGPCGSPRPTVAFACGSTSTSSVS